MDLRDLWTGKLSVRRAGALLTNLPPGCATWRIGPDDHAWSHERQGLADVRDALVELFAKEPQPTPRPGDAARAEAEAERILARARLHAERAAARRRAREQGV